MASPTNNDFDYDLLWEAVKWFFGGLSAIFSVVLTALFGRMWREHNKMYEAYASDVDPERIKLQAKIEEMKEEAMNKYHRDVADIKHEFADIKMQVMPILKRMADEEVTLVDKVEMLSERFDSFMKKYEKPE